MKRFLIGLLILVLAVGLVSANTRSKENVRFKLTWQGEETISQKYFHPGAYDLFRNWEFIWYLGRDWLLFATDGSSNEAWVVTFSPFSTKEGDIAVLSQMRQVSSDVAKRNLGLEAEFRVIGNFWLGCNYLESPIFNVYSVEAEDLIRFNYIALVNQVPSKDYMLYVYDLWVSRETDIYKIKDKFSSNNFQLFAKGEIDSSLIHLMGGVGVDLWQINHRLTVDKQIYGRMPWTGIQIYERNEQSKHSEKKFYARPFLLLDANIHIYKGLGFGAQAKLFPKKQIQFPATYKLHHTGSVPGEGDISIPPWKFDLTTSLISFYLSFSF